MKPAAPHSLVFVLLSLSAIGAVAETEPNWPEFRGPTGQGVSNIKGLPVEWNSTNNIAWKCHVPGTGWSSPIFHEGRIYLTTAVRLEGEEIDNHSLRALCLDGRTSDTLWDIEVFFQDGKTAPAIQSKNSHASPTPTLHRGRLYVHFGHQGTACLSPNGGVIWRTREINYDPVHGNGGSMVVVDDLLIFSCDGGKDPFLVALDRNSGKQRWRTARNIESSRPFSFSTPLLIDVNGRPLVVSPGSELVGAYDPTTGQEVWRVHYENGYSVVPRPVYGHGLVFVCSGYNDTTLYAIRPDGRGDVTDTHVAWQTNRRVSRNPSLVISGNELFMVSDDGVANCLDVRTGKPHWTKRLGGHFSASPLLADGRIYFQNETGTGYVIRASSEFRRLAVNKLDDIIPNERTFASYAVGDKALFVRSENHLLRIESK